MQVILAPYRASKAALSARSPTCFGVRFRPPLGGVSYFNRVFPDARSIQARLRRSIAQLCASPASLHASLRQRQSQITGLATGQLQARQLQRNAATDPLGALLGTAFLARGPQQAPRPLHSLGACPELEAALAATWPTGPADRRMGPMPAQAGPTGSSRPTAPPP